MIQFFFSAYLLITLSTCLIEISTIFKDIWVYLRVWRSFFVTCFLLLHQSLQKVERRFVCVYLCVCVCVCLFVCVCVWSLKGKNVLPLAESLYEMGHNFFLTRLTSPSDVSIHHNRHGTDREVITLTRPCDNVCDYYMAIKLTFFRRKMVIVFLLLIQA